MTSPFEERQVYIKVLKLRVKALRRKLQTAKGYNRQRLLDELQKTRWLLGNNKNT